MGRVLRPSGLKGELRVQFFRPRRALLEGALSSPRALKPGRVFLEVPAAAPAAREGWAEPRLVTVERVRIVDAVNVVLRLEGITDRTEAEALQGALVCFDLDDLPPALADDADRVQGALAVDAETGAAIGRVAAIQDNGAQAILVIEQPVAREPSSGEPSSDAEVELREVLVPFVPALVEVDAPVGAAATLVRVHVIPGLLDLDHAE